MRQDLVGLFDTYSRDVLGYIAVVLLLLALFYYSRL